MVLPISKYPAGSAVFDNLNRKFSMNFCHKSLPVFELLAIRCQLEASVFIRCSLNWAATWTMLIEHLPVTPFTIANSIAFIEAFQTFFEFYPFCYCFLPAKMNLKDLTVHCLKGHSAWFERFVWPLVEPISFLFQANASAKPWFRRYHHRFVC